MDGCAGVAIALLATAVLLAGMDIGKALESIADALRRREKP